jgi:hypothetical protein
MLIEQMTFQEFCGLHGQPVKKTIKGQGMRGEGIGELFLFADGARSKNTGTVLSFTDPPTEPGALLKRKLEYLSARIEQEETAWVNFRNECLQQLQLSAKYSNLPGPGEDAVEQLKAGLERIGKLKQQRAQLQEQFDSLPEQVAQRQAQQAQQEQQFERASRAAAVMGEINALSLEAGSPLPHPEDRTANKAMDAAAKLWQTALGKPLRKGDSNNV